MKQTSRRARAMKEAQAQGPKVSKYGQKLAGWRAALASSNSPPAFYDHERTGAANSTVRTQ